jgi:hypothetical protein
MLNNICSIGPGVKLEEGGMQGRQMKGRKKAQREKKGFRLPETQRAPSLQNPFFNPGKIKSPWVENPATRRYGRPRSRLLFII